jgi:hypothetical protein
MAKHKYADLLIAYANDSSLKFQYRLEDDVDVWVDSGAFPSFSARVQWRIKPTPKRAFVYMVKHTYSSHWYPQTFTYHDDAENARNVALSFNYTVTDIKEVEFE